MTSTQADPFIGRLIENRFEIVSQLGSGGMAVVYKAQHKQVDLTVAIKILQYKFASQTTNIERFKREAKTVNSLFHPNIITMYSFGILETGEPYLVFDCLPGQSLSEKLKSSGRLDAKTGLDMFLQLCRGLGYAHEQGVLHRDLKPSNVMLVPGEDGAEVVKILDFGIAKFLPNSGQEAQQLTQAGEIFGSPLYMSPEQCQGDDLDQRSDIYAMGCLMYEVLAGQLPLLGKNVLATMAKHISEMPPRFESIGVDVPPLVEQIVFKALQKKPDERFQSMNELAEALSQPIV